MIKSCMERLEQAVCYKVDIGYVSFFLHSRNTGTNGGGPILRFIYISKKHFFFYLVGNISYICITVTVKQKEDT